MKMSGGHYLYCTNIQYKWPASGEEKYNGKEKYQGKAARLPLAHMTGWRKKPSGGNPSGMEMEGIPCSRQRRYLGSVGLRDILCPGAYDFQEGVEVLL